MNEEWLPYPNTHLEFSNNGQCRNIKNKRLLRPSVRKKYLCITTKIKQKTLNIPVHRAVAILFIKGETEKRNQINHINCDKLDNHYLNLEWSTCSENIRHALRNKLRIIPCGQLSGTSKVDDIKSLVIRTFSQNRETKLRVNGVYGSRTMTLNHSRNKNFTHLPIVEEDEIINERNKYGNDFVKR